MLQELTVKRVVDLRIIQRKRENKYRESHPWYSVLKNARRRCNAKTSNDYKDYGGRGIKCFITLEEVKALWIRDKANLINNPIFDRIDNDGNYIFKNCRFTTPAISAMNKRNTVTIIKNKKRVCTECKILKSFKEFHKSKNEFMGIVYICKICSEKIKNPNKRCNSKLIPSQVIEIRKLFNDKKLNKIELAKKFKVTPSNINYLLKGKTWKNLLMI